MDSKDRMMPIILNLSEPEVATIRSWYEYATSDVFHFGGSPQLFPTEQIVLSKLNNHDKGSISLSRSDVECIVDWMERAIGRKYGSERFLFGYEELVYRKIREAMTPGEL